MKNGGTEGGNTSGKEEIEGDVLNARELGGEDLAHNHNHLKNTARLAPQLLWRILGVQDSYALHCFHTLTFSLSLFLFSLSLSYSSNLPF